ncbi:MAG: RNase adapter RapZ [Lachnospiraceae bacterium]|nr:RNase adapter RapZ [Lachnospiraceae bacterium]
MKLVIITGMSGAGKSTAFKMMEDIGFYCVDNLPVPLMDKFVELANLNSSELQKVAIGVDVRNGQPLEELDQVLDRMEAAGNHCDILFLDAEDSVLVKRYKETRRSHPLAGSERVDKGLAEERRRLAFLKKRADYIIDTSHLLTRELKAEINRIFVDQQDFKNLFVTVLSFGFKYGIPADSDLVFDVRFLPNPYYVEGLRAKNGNDKEIQDFVLQYHEAHEFLDKLEDMINFLIPNYISEGKNQLVISIGCTGGKHRSVTLANELFHRLEKNKQLGLKIEHRDIEKDALRLK